MSVSSSPTSSLSIAPPHRPSAPVPMGSLERAACRRAIRAGLVFSDYRQQLREGAARKFAEEADEADEELDLPADLAANEATSADQDALLEALQPMKPPTPRRPRFGRDLVEPEPPHPARIAASLLLARLLDQAPGLPAAIQEGAPVILLDAPDPVSLPHLARAWRHGVPGNLRVIDAGHASTGLPTVPSAVLWSVPELLKARDLASAEERALVVLQASCSVLVVSPAARSHLPDALNEAATHRLQLPPFDARTIRMIVRLVTGTRIRLDGAIEPDAVLEPDERVSADTPVDHGEPVRSDSSPLNHLAGQVTWQDLVIAVRHDRGPAECLRRLTALVVSRQDKRGSRDLTLDELHGMDPVVAWAGSLCQDLAAWRRGEIAWAQVDHACLIDGPPGTGKTTAAQVIARHLGLPLITASRAGWQGADEGHLGHLLRAMRRTFDEARRQAPAVLFIDEVDSFADRSGLTHAHRTYDIEVVNALLEQTDGLAGREGLVLIGASNDARRCDPALLRPGRFGRVIRLTLPDAQALAKMLRVRLRGELSEADIDPVARRLLGATGAEVERVVNDARRRARQAGRAMDLDDLLASVDGDEIILPETVLWRAAVHEAGHAVSMVLHHGPGAVTVRLQPSGSEAGYALLRRTAPDEGTRGDLFRLLVDCLSGRAAEEVVLGTVANGAGGPGDCDLAQATRMAAAMVASYGLAGPHPLLHLALPEEAGTVLASSYLRKEVNEVLESAYAEAIRQLRQHKAALEEVARQLVERRHLDGEEVTQVIASLNSTQLELVLAC